MPGPARVELNIDVTEAAGLGEQATTALTVHLPDPNTLASVPTVCFAKPGGGYTREYFTTDLPGPARGARADWHARRGWIFVSVDHLGVGGSSAHHAPERLGYRALTSASHAAEQAVLDRLAAGTVAESFPALTEPVVLGIGQSMGGALTVVQQAHHRTYDGIAVVGYGAVHSQPPVPPGAHPLVLPWIPRDAALDDPIVLNAARVEAARRAAPPPDVASESNTWLLFHDDVDPAPARTGSWVSTTYPMGVITTVLTPGVIAPEAAAIDVPVLVATGERDIVPDPRGEPRAYLSAPSVDLYICPRMAHMHNFAGTRTLLWSRIETWAQWAAVERDLQCWPRS